MTLYSIVLVFLGVSSAGHAFPLPRLPRPVIKSFWSTEAETPWDLVPEQEAAGLSFKAVNDEKTLRVRIQSLGRDSRNLLSGIFRQDLTIWFLKPDGQERAWGLRLPFGRLPPNPEFLLLADWKPGDETPAPEVAPERVAPSGPFISSSSLTADIAWRAVFSERKPAYELHLPIEKLPSKFFDFTASRAPALVESRFQTADPKGRARPYEREQPQEDNSVGRIGPVKIYNSNYRRVGPFRGGEMTPPFPRHLRFALRLAKPARN